MVINGNEVSINDLLLDEDLHNNLHEVRDNNLFLSDYQINVLKRNQIVYEKCNSMKELLFQIEEVLNESYDIDSELEEVSRQIEEYRYYNEINH